jgi:Leucine-rich repeat (LRR) protein
MPTFHILRARYPRISEIPEEIGKLVNLYNFYVNDNKVSAIC